MTHVRRLSGYLLLSRIPTSFLLALRGGVLDAPPDSGQHANRRRRAPELSDVTETADFRQRRRPLGDLTVLTGSAGT